MMTMNSNKNSSNLKSRFMIWKTRFIIYNRKWKLGQRSKLGKNKSEKKL